MFNIECISVDSKSNSFVADRPFMFLVWENATSSLLFFGTYTGDEAKSIAGNCLNNCREDRTICEFTNNTHNVFTNSGKQSFSSNIYYILYWYLLSNCKYHRLSE